MGLVRDRRPSTVLVGAGVALAMGAGMIGYLAGALVKSPAQAIAETAPPGRTVLTEKVTSTKVTRSVTFDGVVERQYLTEVGAPPAEKTTSIVTRLPVKVGERLKAGDLIAEVSGRPVIVLQGKLPSYRPLSPGSTGPDVAQLQRALTAAGHRVNDTGTYGPRTAAAVAALYANSGYEAVAVGTEGVNSAQGAVRNAERELSRQKASNAGDLALKYAQEDLGRARAALTKAQSAAGAQIPVGEVVFVPDLPASVNVVKASVGQAPETSLMTLSSGPLVVRGTPVSADAQQIHKGDRATMLLSPHGEATGTVSGSTTGVSAAGNEDEGGPVGQSDRTYTVAPRKKLPADRDGAHVRVLVAVEAAPSTGLTVPISAVSVSAAGRDSVTVVADGRHIDVDVTPGFAGDGMVQVTSAEKGALQVGDAVVVGAAAVGAAGAGFE